MVACGGAEGDMVSQMLHPTPYHPHPSRAGRRPDPAPLPTKRLGMTCAEKRIPKKCWPRSHEKIGWGYTAWRIGAMVAHSFRRRVVRFHNPAADSFPWVAVKDVSAMQLGAGQGKTNISGGAGRVGRSRKRRLVATRKPATHALPEMLA